MFSEDEIRQKLEATEEELFTELGLALGRGAAAGDPKNRGASFFKNIHAQLQDSICKSESIRFMYEKHADTIFLVAAIADPIVLPDIITVAEIERRLGELEEKQAGITSSGVEPARLTQH